MCACTHPWRTSEDGLRDHCRPQVGPETHLACSSLAQALLKPCFSSVALAACISCGGDGGRGRGVGREGRRRAGNACSMDGDTGAHAGIRGHRRSIAQTGCSWDVAALVWARCCKDGERIFKGIAEHARAHGRSIWCSARRCDGFGMADAQRARTALCWQIWCCNGYLWILDYPERVCVTPIYIKRHRHCENCITIYMDSPPR